MSARTMLEQMLRQEQNLLKYYQAFSRQTSAGELRESFAEYAEQARWRVNHLWGLLQKYNSP